MSESEVLDKIHLLPKQVQKHLFLYVDFLYSTYLEQGSDAPVSTFFNENELTESGKEMLEQRVQQALDNNAKRQPWKEVRNKIHQKHNLPQ